MESVISGEAGGTMRWRPEWSSADVLGDAPVQLEHWSESQRSDLQSLFETDAASEFDARHLTAYLAPRLASFPPELRDFLTQWDKDEQNHYEGLRRLLGALTGQSDRQIDAAMAARPVDFGPIDRFLDDPFVLLVSFAYDERVTVQAYAMDYPVYDALGTAAGLWLRLTNRDEALHYRNALALAKALFPGRLKEARDILDALVDHDERRQPYGATFLLDHDDGSVYFTDARLRKCARIVERALMRT